MRTCDGVAGRDHEGKKELKMCIEVSFTDPSFDITHVYDDPAMGFSLERVTEIQRQLLRGRRRS